MRRPPSFRSHRRGRATVPAAMLAASLVVLTLAGCGAGPARADAAAVVGDRVVPIDQVQQQLQVLAPQLQRALDEQATQNGQAPGSPPPPDVMATQARRLLTVDVFHELLSEVAAREGLQASPQQVDAAIAALGGPGAAAASGYDDATFRQVVADRVIASSLGRRYFDRLAVRVDFATLPNRAQADALAARVASAPDRDATTFAAVPATDKRVDPPAPQPPLPALRPGTDSGNGDLSLASSALFGLPPGTVAVVSPPSSGQSDSGDPASQPWMVVHVLDRSVNAAPTPGLVPASAVDDRSMTEVGLRLIQPLALGMGVTINPRYGSWDPSQLAIVGSPAAAGSVLPVPGSAP